MIHMLSWTCIFIGVFRSIGPKPTKEEQLKKKARRFWIWHEFKELFFCCEHKAKKNFIDIIGEPDDGRSSRLSTMTTLNSLGILTI